MMSHEAAIQQAIQTIQSGGLLVYPTEAVFGLGCDFRNQAAVERLLKAKNRDISKGLILIASHVQQILPLIKLTDQTHLARALKTWPGHHTWVFEASDKVPAWITGDFSTVAVRVSAHPEVKALCDALGQPIVSTSANVSGQEACTDIEQAKSQLAPQVDYFWDAPLGQSTQTSRIRLASDGSVLR